MKTKINKFLLLSFAALAVMISGIGLSARASAAVMDGGGSGGGTTGGSSSGGTGTIQDVSSTKCKNSTTAELNKCLKTNPIVKDIQTIVNFLSALVGVVVVAVLILGGIQYSGSRDNPQALQAAKHRIQNAILALVMYFLVFAFLQWLIPGGVFA